MSIYWEVSSRQMVNGQKHGYHPGPSHQGRGFYQGHSRHGHGSVRGRKCKLCPRWIPAESPLCLCQKKNSSVFGAGPSGLSSINVANNGGIMFKFK